MGDNTTVSDNRRSDDRRWGALEAWQKEINRRLDELTRLVSKLIDGEKELTVITELNMRVAALEKQAEDMKGFKSWITKTVLGAIVLAIVAFLLRGGINV